LAVTWASSTICTSRPLPAMTFVIVLPSTVTDPIAPSAFEP
jgi:hypothetical protein